MAQRTSFGIIGLLLAVTLQLQAGTASVQKTTWEGLSIVLGKQVTIVMPGGTIIRGKAKAVEPDALTMQVKQTTDPIAYPKGFLRIPRETLRVLQLQTKGTKFRIIGTALGAVAGLAGGGGAAIAIQGGILSNNNPGGAAAALIGITAVGTTVGYLTGDKGDTRSLIIEIVQ